MPCVLLLVRGHWLAQLHPPSVSDVGPGSQIGFCQKMLFHRPCGSPSAKKEGDGEKQALAYSMPVKKGERTNEEVGAAANMRLWITIGTWMLSSTTTCGGCGMETKCGRSAGEPAAFCWG